MIILGLSGAVGHDASAAIIVVTDIRMPPDHRTEGLEAAHFEVAADDLSADALARYGAAAAAKVARRMVVPPQRDGGQAQYIARAVPDCDADTLLRRLFWELNSGAFLRFLGNLTGIRGLLPDPTLQGSGIEGALTSDAGDGLVTVTSYEPDGAGTYVYDLDSERFLRVTDRVSSWGTSGPTQDGQFLWNTPENRGRGMTQHLGELVD